MSMASLALLSSALGAAPALESELDAGSVAFFHVLPPLFVWSGGSPDLAGLCSHERARALEPSDRRFREAFQRVPGLQMQDSFGGIDSPRLSVRGSGIQSAPTSRGVQLWFDGFPLSFADGSFNLTLVETSWLNRAQLIAGPAAGVPALGGGLAIWSRPGSFSGERSVRAGYGSHEERWFSIQAAGRAGGNDLVGAGAVFRSDGWRLQSRQSRESVLASARLSGANSQGNHMFRFYATRPSIEVPGPLSMAAALETPDQVSPIVARGRPKRTSEYAQLGWRFTMETPQGYASMGLSAARYRDEFQQLMANGITSTSQYDLSLFGSGRWNWDAARHPRTDLRVLFQAGTREDLRYRNDAGRRGPLIGDNRLIPSTSTIALSHAVEVFNAVEVEAGASAIHARRRIGERFPASEQRPSTELSLSDFAIAPRVSLSWMPTNPSMLYLSWSRTYEPPTFNDMLSLGGPSNERSLQSRSFDWQRASSWETGLRWVSERLTWTAAAYHSSWRNELLMLSEPDGSPRGTVNAGKTLHYGWQASLDLLLFEREDYEVRAWAVIHRNLVRFDSDPVHLDKRLAGVPKNVGSLGFRAENAAGWFVIPSLRWQSGPTWADHQNTLSYGGFDVWNVDVGRRHPKGWEVRLTVENIFDKGYIASTAGVVDRAPDAEFATLFLPGAPRRFHASIGYTW